MKIFGSWSELLSIVFKKNSNSVTLRPNQATTYTASRDIQLPPGDAAHVLMSADSTQTASNKTLDNSNTVTVKDTLLTIQDDGDTTKQLKFQASGITTGTTRTLTAPDASGTVALTSNKLSAFAATSSSELAGVISDETGSGALVFGTSPTVASPTFTGTVLLQNPSGAQPELHLSEDPDNGTNVVKIKAPATLGADYTLTLPTDDGGVNQVLQTDGSGVLTWATVASTVTSTRGDMIRRGAAADERFALGSNGKFLRAGANDPDWSWSNTTAAKSADYTVTDTDGIGTVLMTTGAFDRTVTLPAAANNSGRELAVKKVDSGAGKVSITRAGSDTIDGYTTTDLTKQYAVLRLVSDGTSWHVLSVSGEYMEVTQTTYTNFPASGQAGDLGSLALSAGKWDLSFNILANTGSASVTGVEIAVTSHSGNDLTGFVEGVNEIIGVPAAANKKAAVVLASYPVSLTSATTYYGKIICSYTVSNYQYVGRLMARRVG